MSGAASTLEIRRATVDVSARGRKLEGYAALFGAEARIGSTVETIRAGAFAATLASGRDVLALVDHDPARLLARTKTGTLRLSEDARGLAFSLDLPDTGPARDVLALAERGDLGGMSFGFRATDEHWSGDRREIRAAELFEISVVQAFPAYEGTTVEPRARHGGAPPAGLRRVLERWRA
jgi:HK97 family phage prohead protease